MRKSNTQYYTVSENFCDSILLWFRFPTVINYGCVSATPAKSGRCLCTMRQCCCATSMNSVIHLFTIFQNQGTVP